MSLKSIMAKIHLWLGLASGLVVLVVSLSGAIWCWEEELQDLFLPYRQVARQDKKPLLPSELLEQAQPHFNQRAIHSIAYRGADKSALLYHWGEENDHPVTYGAYLDPYDGFVLKVIEGSSFFDVLLEFHMTLLLGEVGGQIVSYATLIFVVMLLTGIVLWWP
ncbi:MAG: PepSY-associated TM helix domain-containing protein, partial [Bacteroidota bacterium]